MGKFSKAFTLLGELLKAFPKNYSKSEISTETDSVLLELEHGKSHSRQKSMVEMEYDPKDSHMVYGNGIHFYVRLEKLSHIYFFDSITKQ